jgi:UDP-N-acetylmuramoylalanine--D-glutamate ligase
VPALIAHAKAVVLIGRDAGLIEQSIEQVCTTGPSFLLHRCDTLESAVQTATLAAQPGDFVLLSPACASFDMFKGYVHRAQVFHDAVQALVQAPTSEQSVQDQEVEQS